MQVLLSLIDKPHPCQIFFPFTPSGKKKYFRLYKTFTLTKVRKKKRTNPIVSHLQDIININKYMGLQMKI